MGEVQAGGGLFPRPGPHRSREGFLAAGTSQLRGPGGEGLAGPCEAASGEVGSNLKVPVPHPPNPEDSGAAVLTAPLWNSGLGLL